MSRQQKVAAAYQMPFGKYKGIALRHIVQTDPLYLDWLADQPFLMSETKAILKEFLAIDWVATAVQDAVDRQGD